MANSASCDRRQSNAARPRIKRLCNTIVEESSRGMGCSKQKKMEVDSVQGDVKSNQPTKSRKGKSRRKQKDNGNAADDHKDTEKERKRQDRRIQSKKAKEQDLQMQASERENSNIYDADDDQENTENKTKEKNRRLRKKRAKEQKTKDKASKQENSNEGESEKKQTNPEERKPEVRKFQQKNVIEEGKKDTVSEQQIATNDSKSKKRTGEDILQNSEGNGVEQKDNKQRDNQGKEVDLAKMMKIANIFKEVKAIMEKNKDNLSAHEQILREVEKAALRPQKVLGDSQLIWKIPNFREKYKMARAGEEGKTIVYSPEFETHKNGYKIALSLCPNGDGLGKNEYMSIFFTILRGKYDALQCWPFCSALTFTILDQSEAVHKHHITAKFAPNAIKENGAFLGKPVNYRNPSLGIPRFVNLREMWKGTYVRDDTIIIKVGVSTEDIIQI